MLHTPTKIVQGWDVTFTVRTSPENDPETYNMSFTCQVLDSNDPSDTYTQNESSNSTFYMLQAVGFMLQSLVDSGIEVMSHETIRFSETTTRDETVETIGITPPEEPTP